MTEQQTYGGYTDDTTALATDAKPDQANPQQARKSSPLEDLKAAIKAKTLRNLKTYQVDGYDFDIKLRFNAYISADEFKSFQRQASGAKNRKARRAGSDGSDIDQFKLFAAILQEKSEAIILNDDEVRDADGDPLTLRSDEFIQFVKDSDIGQDVNTTAEAIEAFLTAGEMIKLGESIATEAGFGGEVEPVNP